MMRLAPLLVWLGLAACEVGGPLGTLGIDNDDDTYNNQVDCDDDDPAVHPDATEVCDGIDNNCSDEVDDEGVCERTETFNQATTLDILFVMDSTASMLDLQQQVAAGVDSLLAAVDQGDSNLHVGTITMNMELPTTSGRLRDIDGRRWSGPDLQGEALADWVRASVLAGASSGGDERALDALMAALTNEIENVGFRRDRAPLTVIVVSDEDDQSDLTVDRFIAQLPGVEDQVRLHAIVATDDACPNQVGSRYLELAGLTGGAQLSACETSFGPFLSAIGQLAATEALHTRFPLGDVVRPGSLTVRVTLPGGTIRVLDPDEDTALSNDGTELILLGQPPPLGSVIEVSWTTLPP